MINIAQNINEVVDICHQASYNAGWWSHSKTGLDLKRVLNSPANHFEELLAGALAAQKICLMHSEASEMMEGNRKGLMDDKLPHLSMELVEAADIVIRVFDYMGARGYDLGSAIEEKLAFNAVRPDHKKENREAIGGKAY